MSSEKSLPDEIKKVEDKTPEVKSDDKPKTESIDKKVDENPKTESDDKDADEKSENESADKKIEDTPDDEKNAKIIPFKERGFFDEKLSQINEFFGQILETISEEVSFKFVAAVAGGVLFCVIFVGIVLTAADTSPKELPGKVATSKTSKIENEVDVPENRRVHVKIREGMSTGEIAEELEKKDVISSSLKFRILSRIRDYDGKMKAGTYSFQVGMNDDEVFDKLLKGEKKLIKFTIPEGFTVKQIAERLYSLDLADEKDFLDAAEDFEPYDYMKKHKDVFYAAEGFLFPDTYSVETDISIDEILQMMAHNLDTQLTEEMRKRAKEENLTIYELITLASLVEKEVRYPEDRAVVAQVFLKRLKINMPLQTDASLQYLMDAPKEDVSIEDTKIDSPYNTYQNSGLPPGPVANPGMEAIKAVLQPADTDFLYFVADREGHNHYSGTYEDHMDLVYQYR